jgi:hypothetical protein
MQKEGKKYETVVSKKQMYVVRRKGETVVRTCMRL